jgi:hypothetical protein
MSFSQNAYPNPENFAELSFPEEVVAPAVDPDEGETILVAYNPEWSKVLAATCDQMLQFTSWVGTHDEKILAVDRALSLKILLQTPFEVPERDYPAPYWDDDEDVDQEQPIESQTWYGQVSTPDAPADELTFVENAVIWLFAGFVAIVASPALPAGIAAALAFRTLAVRFTLAFNRGDVREQFRVIIDASDYTVVDTGDMDEGEQVEIDVDGLEDADFHDILIVRTLPE